LIETGAADTNAWCGAKEAGGRGQRVGSVAETDAAKWRVLGSGWVYAEAAERIHRRRHQPLAASLVDGRALRVCNRDGKASARSCNGCCETGWASTGDEEIGRVQLTEPFVIQRAVD
jgi:hypothetical protein